MQYQRAAVPQHQAGSDAAYHLCHALQAPVHLHLLHAEREIVHHGSHELFGFIILAHKRFHNVDARQLLLQHAEKGVPFFAQLLADGANVADKQLVVQHIKGDGYQGDKGKPPLNIEQHGKHDNHAHRVRHKLHKVARNHLLNKVNIAHQARDNFARLPRVVVGEGQAIQVAIGLKAQIENNALPQPADDIVERERDHAAQGVQRENADSDPVQRSVAMMRQHVVKRVLQQFGHDNGRGRLTQQQEDRQPDALAIGA